VVNVRTGILLGLLLSSVLLLSIWWHFRTPPPITEPLHALEATEWPGDLQDDLDPASLVTALGRSLQYLTKLPPDTEFTFGPQKVPATKLITSYTALIEQVTAQGASALQPSSLRRNFDLFESKAPSVLFTGYFEAELRASRTQTPEYNYPLYRKPEDLLLIDLPQFITKQPEVTLPALLRGRINERGRVVPYFSRAEIDFENKLQGKNLELAWTNDPVGAFFLHIQGSGVLQFEDGTSAGISYAEANGHPYRPIGKLLIEQNILTRENVSMQSIQKFLRENPARQEDVFRYNPSYIFFRERPDGARGSLDLPLTNGRSIATDQSLFPRGALALIDIPQLPPGIAPTRISRLVVNQDTGGAIRGAGRVDLFTGRGTAAEELAGRLNQRGRLWFLVPKQAATR
jgi:membrane-bound lytic murein transglycosylase A